MDFGVIDVGGKLMSTRGYNMSHQIKLDDDLCVGLRWMAKDASMVIQMHPTTIKASKNGTREFDFYKKNALWYNYKQQVKEALERTRKHYFKTCNILFFSFDQFLIYKNKTT